MKKPSEFRLDVSSGLYSLGGGGAPPWTPMSLPNTALWFDPSQLAANQGDVITSMPNLANTAIMANIVASGTGKAVQQIRGQKAIKHLRTSIQNFGNPLLSGAFAYPFYVFKVWCANDPNTTATLVGGAPASADTFRIRNVGTANTYPKGNTMLGSLTISRLLTTPAGAPRAAMFRADGTNSMIRTAGFSDVTGNIGTLAMTGVCFGIDSGGGNTFGGCQGESFFHFGALTGAQEIQALSYCESKWKTTAASRSIMGRGDSNMNGFGPTVNDCGPRGELERWGQTAPGGFYLDFMGPVQFATLANSNHAGYNGATILDHLNGSVPLAMSTPSQLAGFGYLPNISILDIGINDANNTTSDVHIAMRDNVSSLLDAIIAANPTEKILLCSLNQSQTSTTNVNIDGYNALLPAVASARSANVVFCDTGGAIGPNPGSNGFFADNLHRSVLGQSRWNVPVQAALRAMF